MTYFQDLSQYEYLRGFYYRPHTVNIGWLDAGHAFEKMHPSEELLDLIWDFCKINVAGTRGGYICQLCATPYYGEAERHGEQLTLGTSEIRVFSRDGTIYAAPTLIYHYMLAHHYSPPEEFLQALYEGPRPQSPEYFAKLASLKLEWDSV